ncbi:MAG: hypothetical protein J0I12_05910 [Candidatus Eremiobacteraeota bacterium]|nr:hypothetical protein [Candidatus Eremiobacteraeota bacterium]
MDKCPHCGARGQLAHYTAGKYWKFAGISLFSSGRVRIEDECRICRKNRKLDYSEWERRRDLALSERSDHLQTPAEALAFLETVLQYSALEDLQEEAQELTDRFSDNPHIMALLGNAFSHFREWEQADAFFEAAGTTPECECLRAIDALRRGYPAEAAPKLEFIFQEQLSAYRDTLYLLAEAYQARGQMDEAAQVLDRIEKIWPSQAVEPEHKWYRKRNHGKKHLPTLALKSSIPAVPFFAQPVVYGTLIPLLLCYLGVTWWAGQIRPIYLLNGTDAPYDIEIAGKRRTLVPGRPELINIAEGNLEYKTFEPGVPSASVAVKTFWLTRAFQKRTFLLNPDSLALLYTERNGYAKRPLGEIDPQFHFYQARRLHELDDIDLPFESFPKEIMVSEGHLSFLFNDVTYLRRLDALAGSAAYLLSLLPDDQARLDYLETGMGIHADMALLEGALSEIAPEKLLDAASRHLEEQSVNTAWHILYQDLAWSKRNLQAEYEQRLKAAPKDPELQFLLARVTGNPELIRTEPISPFALLHRAEAALSRGDFATAEKLSQGGGRLSRPILVHSLVAQGKYQLALALPMEDECRVLALAAAGQLQEAKHCIQASSPTQAEYLGLILAYAQGHPSQQTFKLEGLQVLADLHAGKLDRLLSKAAQASSWTFHLNLFLMGAGKGELERTIDILSGYPPFSPEFHAAELLRQPDPKATRLHLNVGDKRLLLAALCVLDPKRKAVYAPLARKLNFEKSFPYWTIQKITE